VKVIGGYTRRTAPQAIKHILRREMLLARVKDMLRKLEAAGQGMTATKRKKGLAGDCSGLLDCLTLLRDASADCIEAVRGHDMTNLAQRISPISPYPTMAS
jgi:hypothetical protein